MRYPNGYPSNLTTSYDETSLQTNKMCSGWLLASDALLSILCKLTAIPAESGIIEFSLTTLPTILEIESPS
jgi:hypothetical protein